MIATPFSIQKKQKNIKPGNKNLNRLDVFRVPYEFPQKKILSKSQRPKKCGSIPRRPEQQPVRRELSNWTLDAEEISRALGHVARIDLKCLGVLGGFGRLVLGEEVWVGELFGVELEVFLFSCFCDSIERIVLLLWLILAQTFYTLAWGMEPVKQDYYTIMTQAISYKHHHTFHSNPISRQNPPSRLLSNKNDQATHQPERATPYATQPQNKTSKTKTNKHNNTKKMNLDDVRRCLPVVEDAPAPSFGRTSHHREDQRPL